MVNQNSKHNQKRFPQRQKNQQVPGVVSRVGAWRAISAFLKSAELKRWGEFLPAAVGPSFDKTSGLRRLGVLGPSNGRSSALSYRVTRAGPKCVQTSSDGGRANR